MPAATSLIPRATAFPLLLSFTQLSDCGNPLIHCGDDEMRRETPALQASNHLPFRAGTGLRLFAAVLAGVLAAAIWQPATAQAPEKLTVRFTWKLKGEYAPLFVALDK